MFTAIWIIAISLVWILTITISLTIALHYEKYLKGGIFSRINVIDVIFPIGNIFIVSIISYFAYKRKKEIGLTISYEAKYYQLKQEYRDLIKLLIQYEILTKEEIDDLIDSKTVFEKLS